MRKPSIKTLVVFFVAAALSLCGSLVMAESHQLTKPEVDALIQQYLPEGVSLEEADEEQVAEAIAGSVKRRPDDAMNIAFRAAERVPDHAAAIAVAAAIVVPDRSSDIIIAVSNAVPGQLSNIRSAVELALLELERHEKADQVLERAIKHADQSATHPPARDDSPASPVK